MCSLDIKDDISAVYEFLVAKHNSYYFIWECKETDLGNCYSIVYKLFIQFINSKLMCKKKYNAYYILQYTNTIDVALKL